MTPFLRASSFVVVALCCLLPAGCSGCGQGPKKPVESERAKSNPLDLARDLYRGADEASKFRDANEQTNKYLAREPEALAKFHPGVKDKAKLQTLLARHAKIDAAKLDTAALYDKFLEAFVGLDKAERDEVDSGSFKLLDAHHLEMCYFLRDAARAMPLQGLSSLEQAEFCFDWVVRQVILQEARDDLLPPQYVLKRGQGTSAERAFVFVSLLKQLDLDAVVLAVPGKDGAPKPWLVGVFAGTSDKNDLYLFDPRLGLPLTSPGGKGVATLAQLKASPKLLDNFKLPGDVCKYDVDAAMLEKLEILLVAPLSGLSARMRFLEEEVLFGFERISVACRLADVAEKCEALQAGPVRVWNRTGGKAGTMAQTPTRAMSLFLPPEEGGADKGRFKRLQEFHRDLCPWAPILLALAELKLSAREVENEPARQQLAALCQQVWQNYAVVPSQQLLLGRLEDCTKRMVRMQSALKDLEGNLSEQRMQSVIGEWRERLKAALVSGDPSKIHEFWNSDQWLVTFISTPDDDAGNSKQNPPKKTLLTLIVLRAVSQPLQVETDYMLALRWQEKAIRLQMQLEILTARSGNDADRDQLKRQTAEAWKNAGSFWSNYGHHTPLAPQTVQANLKTAVTQAQAGLHGLVDYEVWMIREAAAVKLMQAQALAKLGKKDQAEILLQKLADDLGVLQTHPLWDKALETAPPGLREALRKTMADAAVERGPGGSLFWMRYAALLQKEQLRRSPP